MSAIPTPTWYCPETLAMHSSSINRTNDRRKRLCIPDKLRTTKFRDGKWEFMYVREWRERGRKGRVISCGLLSCHPVTRNLLFKGFRPHISATSACLDHLSSFTAMIAICLGLLLVTPTTSFCFLAATICYPVISHTYTTKIGLMSHVSIRCCYVHHTITFLSCNYHHCCWQQNITTSVIERRNGKLSKRFKYLLLERHLNRNEGKIAQK